MTTTRTTIQSKHNEPAVIELFYQMLGGNAAEFDPETVRRVCGFCSELEIKRKYDRLTVFDAPSDEMIIGNNLRLFSFCEHHILPFFGKVHIGYIPDGKIFGLSKFQRLVDIVASRPQLQERLTAQIANIIVEKLKPKGVGVVVKAIHTCVFARGVQSSSAEFTTNAMLGVFRDKPQARAEFLACINGSNGSNSWL